MDQAVTVVPVRGDNRRGAVAQVLSLLVAEVARCVSPRVMLLPSLAGPGVTAHSTHSETLSATLDAVLAAGANEVTVASGARRLRRCSSRWDTRAKPGEARRIPRSGTRRVPVGCSRNGPARMAREVGPRGADGRRRPLPHLARDVLVACLGGRILAIAERARQSPSGRPGAAPLPDRKGRRLPRRPGPDGRAAPLPGRCIPGRGSRRGESREIEGGRYGDRGPRRGRGRCGRGRRPGVRPS